MSIASIIAAEIDSNDDMSTDAMLVDRRGVARKIRCTHVKTGAMTAAEFGGLKIAPNQKWTTVNREFVRPRSDETLIVGGERFSVQNSECAGVRMIVYLGESACE